MKKLSKNRTNITRDFFAYFVVLMQIFVVIGFIFFQFLPLIVAAILLFGINNYINKISWLFQLVDLYYNGEHFIAERKNVKTTFIKEDIESLKVRTGKVKLVTKKGVFYFLYRDKYDLYFYFNY